MGGITQATSISLLLLLCASTTITVLSPPELASQFAQPIAMHVSPIGFRPLSGRLEGTAAIANPLGACNMITDAHSYSQDFFVFADDSECLQSVKAKHIANSGAYVGIVRQNINNTLHDKEVSLVHIPIVELPPESFDALIQAIQASATPVTLSLDFTERALSHKVNLQVWFSPTQLSTYAILLDMRQFLLGQGDIVSFKPHYVLQSQREAKKYIGCYSSGRYCPCEIEFEGKYEGVNIVEETLRQIIIWKISHSAWWSYIQKFYQNCLLANSEIFTSRSLLDRCSENSMLMSDIDMKMYQKQYNGSFLGSQKEVVDNTYLLEERQHYLREQLTSHPAALLNKKSINLDAGQIQEKICKMQGQQQSGPCISKNGLSTIQILIIVSVVFVVFVAIAALYRLYIYLRMKNEIKSEVDKTLEQYYKYMDAFQDDPEISSKKKKPAKTNSVKLTEELENAGKQEKQMEMSEIRKK